MVVSKDIQTLAILIPKTGTRSILNYMQNYHNGKLEGNHRMDIPEKYKDYFSFCVVRNPYSRIISHWFGGSQRGEESKRFRFQEVIGDLSFKSYLRYLINKEKYNDRLNWPFEIKQIDYMGNDYDRILEFEDLVNQFYTLPFVEKGHVLKHINSTQNISKANPLKKRNHWSEYYDQECFDMVNKYFKEDFEYLNNKVFKKEKYPVCKTIDELERKFCND